MRAKQIYKESSKSTLAHQTENPYVSTKSTFNDLIWDFKSEIANPTLGKCQKRINWGFKLKNGDLFTDERYASLFLSCKQLVYSMLWHPVHNRMRKPISIVLSWTNIRCFINFIVTRPYPVKRFKDVTAFLVDEYIKEVKAAHTNGEVERSTVYRKVLGLKYLFDFRDKMVDGISIDPLRGESPGKIAGLTQAYQQQQKTEYIPDELLARLIATALDYVEVYADFLIETFETYLAIRRQYESPQYQIEKWFPTVLLPEAPNASFRLEWTSIPEFQKHLLRLRTACAVLIAFITGMRISEILSIEEGCIETEVDNNNGEFIWVISTLYKVQRKSEGTVTKWLGGPIAAKSIRVLERLTAHARDTRGCKRLFVPTTRISLAQWTTGGALTGSRIEKDINEFVKWMKLKEEGGEMYCVTPHMFRRTFARQVIRCNHMNILALKEHFKHVSLMMTDHYLGVDDELLEMLRSEEDKLSFETFDKVMSAHRLGGPRGKEVVRQVDAAIADGRLPPEFRGEAGAHLRRQMIVELIESGQQIYPCGMANHCWYRMETALCSQSDLPVLALCNPSSCANSIIGGEHAEYWEGVEVKADQLLRLNPKGAPYRERLVKLKNIASRINKDLHEK